ncbi:hypothetical protein BU24DRAFT_496350 [Aaosphaeria arxii CBS 175.79]|uniref:Uncharacterized protein n=1 Tax=Aaosphaeria arxii CBS 175.79 TaxID=1450172 RepID=A0A6A5XBV3_9PLEO|nr:uncharacterized protein BU24DRAFT_496350 [Aaosphaeria arxii CBS 175.79]KAF2010326.1 hypothetical protein BU24DRAFT_496350 [Aaosphaeria arxii CBS 175.79]
MLSESPKTSQARQPRKWTAAEDQILREEVEQQQRSDGEAKDWIRVAESLPGRSNKDCRKRWKNSVVGTLKKGQWSKSEDTLLEEGIERYGQKWTLVADVVASRSADQCSKRWSQSLAPYIDRSEWRESEDDQLIQAVQKFGRHWKDINRYYFPRRSKNSIKNRYTVLLRRYQNQGISLSEGPTTSDPASPQGFVDDMPTDDESQSIATSSYDVIRTPRTQVSTPESPPTWPIMNPPSAAAWSAPNPYVSNNLLQSPSSMYYPPTQVTNANVGPWNWSSASPTNPPTMTHPFVDPYAHAPEAQYSPYGNLPNAYDNSTTLPPAMNFNQSYNSTTRSMGSSQGPRTAPFYQPDGAGPSAARYERYDAHPDRSFYRH